MYLFSMPSVGDFAKGESLHKNENILTSVLVSRIRKFIRIVVFYVIFKIISAFCTLQNFRHSVTNNINRFFFLLLLAL